LYGYVLLQVMWYMHSVAGMEPHLSLNMTCKSHFKAQVYYCPPFWRGIMFLPVSVCLFVCLLPKYLKNCWRYFNFFIQVQSFMEEEELINFWLRSDSRWPTDHRICLKPIFAHKSVLDWDIDFIFCVWVLWRRPHNISYGFREICDISNISKTFRKIWKFFKNRLVIPHFKGNCDTFLMVHFII